SCARCASFIGARSRSATRSLAILLSLTCHACVQSLRSRGDRGLRCGAWPAVQAAFLLVLLLPPPAAGALGLAWLHRAGAGRAADRQKARVMQGVVGNAVLVHEGDHALARPVEEGIKLDQAARAIDGRIGCRGALP